MSIFRKINLGGCQAVQLFLDKVRHGVDDILFYKPRLNDARHHDIIREDRYCRVNDGRLYPYNTTLGCSRKNYLHPDTRRTSAHILGHHRVPASTRDETRGRKRTWASCGLLPRVIARAEGEGRPGSASDDRDTSLHEDKTRDARGIHGCW